MRTPPVARNAAGWEFRHLHLSDGPAWFEIPSDDAVWDERGISLTLPEDAFDVNARRCTRVPCRGIEARVALGGAVCRGRLLDASASSFSVRLAAGAPEPGTGEVVAVRLARGATALFDAPCRVLRTAAGRGGRTLVLRLDEPATSRSARTSTAACGRR